MKAAINTLIAQFRTLRGFFFFSTVAIALLVFLGATLASSLLYEELIAQRTRETSQDVSKHAFNTLYKVLRNGGSRQQLDEAISREISVFHNAPHQVDIYRSQAFDRASAVVPPADVKQVFSSGTETVRTSGGDVRYLFPVVAAAECLKCHGKAREGEVLGVIAIGHRLDPISAQVRGYFVGLFLFLSIVVLLIAGAVSTFAVRRVKASIDLFQGQIAAVNTIKELNQLDVRQINLGFVEFDEIFQHVSLLVDRVKGIAVDKDILEFEIRLLEKFIINSNVVRDWQEFIKDLLLEINSVIDAYALLTIFQIEDEGFEWEVFWRNTPSQQTVDLFEQIVRHQLEENPHFMGVGVLLIRHHVSDGTRQLPEVSRRDIELQTKSLLLDTPKIGGIVGIGVHSTLAQDPVRHIVIGSILTTLLNLVGSVKAIYKYTKDLEYYATRDPLTDLYNQRMFWELLGYEVGRAKRHEQEFAVLMLDMDNFKTINDSYGHHFGDAFLQAFAKLLHEAVRQGDLLARYGGDEFAIILPDTSDAQAHFVAQRIAESLEAYAIDAPNGGKIKATSSIGIAMHPRHGDNPRDLFLIADNMMYKAKRAGKNGIAIASEDELADVFKNASDKGLMIVKALEEQRVVPYFQPIVSTATGEVVIHELLMRLQVDDRIIPADEFIAEAEAMGLVHKMDYQLIGKAFAQVKEQGYRGMLFINLSPKALIVGEFMSRMHSLALDFEIDPSRIVFEITERETVSNLGLLEKFVLDLKSKGFSFAIDDFGSGFSSFHYIKRFPVDYIKIEGEFIRNLLTDAEYYAFTKSIVTLAKELNIETVAEYVEEGQILEAVKRFGIDYAQGFYVGRPGPVLMGASAIRPASGG